LTNLGHLAAQVAIGYTGAMFTAAQLKSAETYLSRHLAANDYYSEGEKVTGKWMGTGSGLLGLQGRTIEARDPAFEALRQNRDPTTGEPLTQRTNEKRIAFYDFQVSAPKSVSILAVTFGDDRLRKAHEEAVAVAFAELECYAARRVRDGNNANTEKNQFTGNLVAAAFTHDASRALDAQLHTHLVCANATFAPKEQRWYALQNREMYPAIELAGRIYQNELARQVVALGYQIRPEIENHRIKGFEIDGLTARDLELQSTRRRQIEAEIGKFELNHGRLPSTGERHVIATSTRSSKLAEITTAEVRASQLERYDDTARERIESIIAESRAHERENSGVGVADARGIERTRAAIESAVEHIAERESVFDARMVLVRVFRENPGLLDHHTVRTLLSERTRDLLVELKEPNTDSLAPGDTRLFSTVENLHREYAAVQMVKDAKSKFDPLAARFALNPNLTPDQRAAVEQILASRDGIMAMRGPAGTGKTTTLSSLDQVVRSVGENLEAVYVAPTHQAKGVLQRDGFKDATTVAQLLINVRSGQSNIAGKLLVVDEAGMQSTKDGHELLLAAHKAGARVLFVGDEKQIPAVAAGDFMAILRKHGQMQTVELSTIFRQRANPEYLQAMGKMATGDVKGSLAMLDRQGRIKEAAGAYLTQAAESYCALTSAEHSKETDPATVALVAPTWKEIEQLTGVIRKDRQSRGQLTGPEVKRLVVDTHDLTAAEKRSERNYQTGMVVSPAERAFGGLQKNQWYEVQSVGEGRITLQNGKQLKVHDVGPKLRVGQPRELPLQVGDRILLQGNDRALGLSNGMRGYVTDISPEGAMRFRESIGGKLADKECTVPASYKTFTHGYAMTIHASQGETVTHVVGAVGRSISGNLWNVLTSRGRRDVTLFVPDKKATIDRAPVKIENRRAALDFRLAAKTPQAVTKDPSSIEPKRISLPKNIARHREAAMIGIRYGRVPPGLVVRYRHFLANRDRSREITR
jgi:conjugative relaxase-like TrwC/TraI family protein